ncbi:S-adenosyl-L-methionine-dependent methyltransferase [Nemania sp. FL0916]|nr:S-adenosyl-L-methionine-dependent methyltransferase [Nemania sp. FL0916]
MSGTINSSSPTTSAFTPKQALTPTPELYASLVSDSMENLAAASLTYLPPIPSRAVINDNGCGTGAASAAIMSSIITNQGKSLENNISIKATDINDRALSLYRSRAAAGSWPAEAVNMDANALVGFESDTFDLSLCNALLFVLPNDGVDAVRETYRTLKPGGVAVFNSWNYVPNIAPIHAAAKATRPEGTPLPRAGMEKWTDPEFLKSVVEKGGFEGDKIEMHKCRVSVTTGLEMDGWANMLWSFIGGTTTAGWLEEDERNWDRAIGIIKREVRRTEGFKELPGGRAQLGFVANVAVARK